MSAWLRRKIHDWYCGADSWLRRIDVHNTVTLECTRCSWRDR